MHINNHQLTSHSHDPYNPSSESLWLVAFVLHVTPTNSLKYPRNWMTAVRSSVTAAITNLSKHNYSNDDKKLHPLIQSSNNSSTLMCSPKHSVTKNEFNFRILLKLMGKKEQTFESSQKWALAGYPTIRSGKSRHTRYAKSNSSVFSMASSSKDNTASVWISGCG